VGTTVQDLVVPGTWHPGFMPLLTSDSKKENFTESQTEESAGVQNKVLANSFSDHTR